MLICNVSLRPPRSAIAAAIVEATTAVDASAFGNIVFATLVDDPASVGEIVDAYLGEIMLEATSASDTVSAGSAYAASVDETMSAVDTQDGTIAITTVTWEPATVASVTLSGGDLVATNTGTTSANQGAHVASTSGRSTGKYYFEYTLTTYVQTGSNGGVGIGTTASTYTNMGNSATTGVEAFFNSGNIYANGSNTGVSITGTTTSGVVFGCAVDLDNRKAWFRKSNGNWNNSGTNNPVTNTGGTAIPAGVMVPFVTLGGSSGAAGNVITANFGASSFTGAVPSGFTSGWPI